MWYSGLMRHWSNPGVLALRLIGGEQLNSKPCVGVVALGIVLDTS